MLNVARQNARIFLYLSAVAAVLIPVAIVVSVVFGESGLTGLSVVIPVCSQLL